ncbi:MAG: hypothetical protein SXG53_23120 [Pseudomonadota bacterium]|nr:hypothetical protein [Pseudomonadota bacterium]
MGQVGVQFDDGANSLATEYGSTRSGRNYVVPSRHGAYVTYGHRFGCLMPYATLAMQRRDEVTRSDAIPAAGPLAALNAGVNGVIASGATDQVSYSNGARYEVPSF